MGLEAGVVGIGLVCGTFTYVKVFVAIVTPVWLSGRASVLYTEGPRLNPGRRQAFSNLLLYPSVHGDHTRESGSCFF
ncbi:hypothetical protein DD237_008284 [Peronospora effusa]|uniref:Uncharacterized protein n=1 Tax=Peronospora effusa TaxID=542832 RepID=A0A425C096_9STRA|nr:hypothetical protein DD237_008284 [Peronospora effusa]